jgi:hypothetical protein
MTWNKKNDQFALSCELRPSATLLLGWILRRAKKNQVDEIEIDLRVFNAWIAKNRDRGGFDRKTLKEAIAQLDEKTKGHVLITKSYTWAIHKILVRPLFFVLQQDPQNEEGTPKLPTGNPMFGEDHKIRVYEQQQQDISRIDHLLRQVNLIFDRDALYRIYRLANQKVDEVVNAIELLLCRNSSKAISKPNGFIIECLKKGWHLTFNPLYEPELPRFRDMADLREFSDKLRQQVKDKYGGDTVYESVKLRNEMCRAIRLNT